MTADAYWQPFTPTAYRERVGYRTIVSGDGAYVTDADGHRLLDGTAGLWCVNVGHGRREIGEAMAAQSHRLAYYSPFEFRTEPAVRLAARLAALLPDGLDHLFFTCGGSEAVETAIKIARGYWSRRGHPERRKILSRDRAYHGVGLGGTSLSGLTPMRVGFEPLLPQTGRIPHNHCRECPFELSPERCSLQCAHELERQIVEEGPSNVAAFVLEAVYGAGGVIPPPPGYLAAIQEICRRHGVLLILDEVITGFGRLGHWFAADRYELEPDLVTMAKGLTSGYAPLGAVAARAEIHDAFLDPEARPVPELAHGFTYSGHPVSCAAAHANLDLLEAEDLPGNVRRHEHALGDALAGLGALACVAEVRSAGFMAAVDYGAERGPLFARRVADHAYALGLIVRPIRTCTALSPPLSIGTEQIGEIADKLGAAIRRASAEAA